MIAPHLSRLTFCFTGVSKIKPGQCSIGGEKAETVADFIFFGSKITADGYCSHKIKRCLLLRRAMTNLDSIWKSRDTTLLTKVHIVKTMVCNHVKIWELDHKEDWEQNNPCFWTVVLENSFESPLDCKIKPVNPKGNQSWISLGRTDAKSEAPKLQSHDMNSQLIGKDPDASIDRRQKEKRMT